MLCRHRIRGCAVCAGLVRWEAPEPSEGTRRAPISHEAEALRITLQRADTRPQAYIHPEPVKHDFPQWKPTTEHPRWMGKRKYNAARKAQADKRCEPSDSLKYRAQQLGVEL